MNEKQVTYVIVNGQRRVLNQPVQDGEIEIFVKNQFAKGVILREETPYIWADFFRVPVQTILNIIEKIEP